jgi:hypothetical protein
VSQQTSRLGKCSADRIHELQAHPNPRLGTRHKAGRGNGSSHTKLRLSTCDGACRYRPMQLLAETGLHGDALASLGAASRNHRSSALGLHASTKSVRLRAATTVGLECALRHAKLRSSLGKIVTGTDKKYNVRAHGLASDGPCAASPRVRPFCLHTLTAILSRNRCRKFVRANLHHECGRKKFFASNIHEINHSQRACRVAGQSPSCAADFSC